MYILTIYSTGKNGKIVDANEKTEKSTRNQEFHENPQHSRGFSWKWHVWVGFCKILAQFIRHTITSSENV